MYVICFLFGFPIKPQRNLHCDFCVVAVAVVVAAAVAVVAVVAVVVAVAVAVALALTFPIKPMGKPTIVGIKKRRHL